MLLDARAVGGAGGGAPLDATFITQTPNATLTNEQALSALATGILLNATGTGVLSIAAQGVDYYAPGGTDVAIADGGTGASTQAGARTNLGTAPLDATFIVQTTNAELSNEQVLASLATGLLKNATGTGVLSIGAAGTDYLSPAAIGVTVQAWDADLDVISGLAKTDGNFIVGDGAAWVVESGATARASLGLGTIAIQNANNVTITGGSITGITDLAIADGGTGQSTAQAAIDALTNVAAATNEHVLTKDTATGNAIFKAAPATGAPVGATYIVQTPDGTLTNEQALSVLATGLLKNTTGTGVLSIAAEGTDYFNPPFLDTNALVKGSADATKLLRFEVDGFTTGTTRILTPPNANATIAGLEVAQTFTAAQKINVNSTTALFVEQDGVKDNVFIVDTTNGFVGINMVPTKPLQIAGGNISIENNRFLYARRTNNNFQEIFGFDNNNDIVINRNSLTAGVDADAPQAASGVIFGLGASRDLSFRNSGNKLVFYMDEATSRIMVLPGTETSATLVTKFAVLDATATTNAVLNVQTIGLNSSGTPAAGFGPGLIFQAESTTTESQNMGRLTYEWATATHASRKALSKWTVFDTAEREGIRIEASGSVAMLGVLGATAIARQAHIVDADGTLADITTKFNTLLSYLENYGFIATS